MFQGGPDQRLWLVKQRNGELIHEAQQNRLARSGPDGFGGCVSTRLLGGLGTAVGRCLAVIRRTLSTSETPCNDPAPERAPC